MNQVNKTILTSALVFAATTGLAQAATVSATAIALNDGRTLTVETDTDTQTSGPATATADFGVFATQNQDGTNEIAVNAPEFVNGRTQTFAQATFSDTITNSSAETFNYTLDFTLDEIVTSMRSTRDYTSSGLSDAINYGNPFDTAPDVATQSAVTGLQYEYEVFADGVSVYSAMVEILGSVRDGIQFTTLNGFSGSLDITDLGFGRSEADITIDALSDTANLGDVAAGDSIEVTTIFTGRAHALRFEGENGVGGFGADPFKISSPITITGTSVTPPLAPVPLPAAGWMLIAGLGGLVAAGRRKKA